MCRLLGLFPDRDYSQLLDWVYKLSRNTKTSYRVFMLDLVGEIVETPLRKPSAFHCNYCLQNSHSKCNVLTCVRQYLY